MIKHLLLTILLLTGSITLSLAQTDPIIGRATTFSALAATEINVTGPKETTIKGNVGISPGNTINGESFLNVSGKIEKGTAFAAEAMRDAHAAYADLSIRTETTVLSPNIGNGMVVRPGVHKVYGDANLDGVLVLDGDGDINSTFIFIIDGNFSSAPNMGQIQRKGAEAKNVYWVVSGEVNISSPSAFVGNIIAQKDITFGESAPIQGRAISLTGAINFLHNFAYLPIVIDANLSVEKTAVYDDLALGAEVTYTINAINRGPGEAMGVIVKENIPSGLEFIRVESVTHGEYSVEKNQWLIGDMAVGEPATLKLTFRIVGAGNIKNEVIIIGDNPDQTPDDDKDDAEIELPDLGVTKTVNGATEYKVGDVVRYTIVATNYASTAEENVVITENLPAGLEYVKHQTSTGTYNPETGLFTIPVLAGNSSATLTIDARLVLAGIVRNVVAIEGQVPGKDTDPDNDEDDEVIEVTCPTPTVAITTPLTTVCAGTANLVFTATPIIGAEYTYQLPKGWTKVAQAGNVITVNAGQSSGTQVVKVTVKDQCGNTATSEMSMQLTGAPTVPVISGAVPVCYNSDGITLEAANAEEGMTYEWTVGVNLEIVGATNGTSVKVKPKDGSLLGGTVTLKAINGCNFESIGTAVLTVMPAPSAPVAITGEVKVCEDKQVTFSTPAVAGATSYTWMFPSDWKIQGAEDGREVTVLVGKVSGNISVKANNACGSSDAFTRKVDVNEPPTIANFTLNGKSTACQGETGIVFTATEIEGASYDFSVDGGLQIVSKSGNTVTVKAGTGNGSVSVTVTDFCRKTLTVSKSVSVTPALANPTITGTDKVCQNSAGNVYTAPAYEGTVSYKWTVSGGLAIASGDNAATVELSAGASGGNLTLEVSNSCFTVKTTKAIGINPVPAKPASVTGNATVCAGSQQTYTAAQVTGASSYTWSFPSSEWTVVSGGDSRTVTVTVGSTGGQVTAKANNACGTSDQAASLTVAVNGKPATPAAINGSNGACIGASLTYSIPAVTGATGYEWAVPKTWTLVSQSGNSIVVKVGEEGGNIRVAVRNECELGEEAVKAVAPVLAPAAPVIAGDTKVCENSQQLTYTVSNPEAGATYTWTLPEGWSFEGGNTGTSVTVNAGTTAGTIKVVSANSCDASEGSLEIEIFTPPVTPGQITDNSNVCDGLVFSIEPIAGANSYTWTVSSGFTITSGQGTNKITVKADRTDAQGTVTVVASNGPCSSMEAMGNIDASKADGNLDFPKAFSPNGDGKNDNWYIRNLDKFPNSEVTIFNRWGSEVFKTKNYQNNWAGKGLEQGTYFYKVRVTLCDGVVKEFTGYTTIFR